MSGPMEKAAEAYRSKSGQPDALEAALRAYLMACAEDEKVRLKLIYAMVDYEPNWDNEGQARAAILSLVPASSGAVPPAGR